MNMASARPFQVIVWGASGYTGRLVCEHIAGEYQGRVQWAMAGRNQGKLEGIREELTGINKFCKDVPIVVADATDQLSVDAMVSQADVVISCAGPFSKYSTPVVDASVRLGTHYCDITGEVLWVRESIQKYHNKAMENKVKIVHCCGFDSVPSDLGTFFLTNHVRSTLNKGCKNVDALVVDAKGDFSGGTIASFKDMLGNMTEEQSKAWEDPYSLNPPDSKRGQDMVASLAPVYRKVSETWTAPSVMEVVNSRVVRRSYALLDNSYGKDFSYFEAMKADSYALALLLSSVYAAAGALFLYDFGRALLEVIFPAPGEGPPRESLEDGFFKLKFIAETEELEGGTPTKVTATLEGRNQDPGYWATSRMVLECALCQVFESDKLKQQGLLEGGVLTPASAFGMVAVERLRASGCMFEIVQQ